VGLELAHVQGVMQLYCRALSGEPVDVLGAPVLVHKGLGWVDDTAASTDGTRIFLPPRVERFPIRQDNFTWLKVVATHQVAHLEFGSFAFSFDIPSTLFSDRRFRRETPTGQRWEAQGQQRPSPPCFTAMERFLRLFANRRLVLDIFTILEDCRVDACIATAYPGMRSVLRRAQAAALASRPRIESLPVQETLVGLLLRMSLEAFTDLPVPRDYEKVALLLARLLQRLRTVGATVEDTAEATLRAYSLISPIPNAGQTAEQWRTAAFDAPGDYSESAYETLLRQWSATRLAGEALGAGQAYRRLPRVDYRGDFKPAMVQLLAQLQQGRHRQDDVSVLSREVLEQALQEGIEVVWDEEYDGPSTGIPLLVRNLVQEVGVPPLPAGGGGSRQADDAQGGPLEAHEVRTYVYDEWDCGEAAYKPRWCLVKETVLAEGGLTFYDAALRQYRVLLTALTRQFERLRPARLRKVYRLVDGEDLDLNAALEAWADLRMHVPPEEKIYWRRDRVQRDVAVAFLLDMSASTAEPLALGDPDAKRLIDLAKESLVLLIQALEVVGDTYGIYGFSGYGRDNVEFYVIKDLQERFGDRIKRRLDTITPAHATRMGAAIRHAIARLESQDAATRLLFLLSDGRPQDRDYPRKGIDKDYAVHDTHMALLEAKRKRITPFCLTVNQAGHDYMQAMCGDIGYEVLESTASLPTRMPTLYRTLTS
jgi:nitric oxide reductase NorD protein